ncbi:hypothetical protein SAMCCGM7_pC1669 (plasmid) [Sinorhizobium americanum CCGM7]|nr:hypothetical protein SAMCCGM7_pC1669 [Sinorhizobium americanum CCGM7]
MQGDRGRHAPPGLPPHFPRRLQHRSIDHGLDWPEPKSLTAPQQGRGDNVRYAYSTR